MTEGCKSVSAKSGWLKVDADSRREIDSFCKNYMGFIDAAKTERETVRESVRLAREQGFVEVTTLTEWAPGARVYFVHRNKAVVFAVLGSRPPVEGLSLVAAHADAPRLDVKPRALREDEGFGLFETHYYGGIKKYQWLSLPLALHGVIVRKDGTMVELSIGSRDDDPVFVIPDVLPHLARKVQLNRTVEDAVPGESLDLIVGSFPLKGYEKEAVKASLLALFKERFGIEEDDFMSAELEIVPVGRSREIGFDGALLGGYGQDDRVCCYTALRALFGLSDAPARTAVVVLADKEEIGSVGNTGMEAAYIDRFVSELLFLSNKTFTPLDLHRTWDRTKVLSADVNAGICPIWPSIHESTNAPRLGNGPVVTKYTGSRGKSGSNDANAEFMAEIRRTFDGANVIWQTGQFGKVEEGGAGTVAYCLANRGAEVVDVGVALLGMHSPFEVASKLDIYHAYLAYAAFLRG